MHYSEQQVIQAFHIYMTLQRDGVVYDEATKVYRADETIRSLLDLYSREVDCVIITAGNALYLIPESRLSPFHVSNDWLKRHYLKANATNADLYLLYFASLIFMGAFYDSYQSTTVTRDFLPSDEWIKLIQERIDLLTSHSEERLIELEKEFSYNWRLIIEKWQDMDDIKESAKKQTGNTISRLSFIDTTTRFLLDQGLLKEVGPDEFTITEKTKTIVESYFMEVEYNKGIFAFLYQFSEEDHDASDLED